MHSYHTGRLYFRLRFRFRMKSSENRLAVICKRLDCTVELNVTMKRTPALCVALIRRKQTRQSSHFNSIEFIMPKGIMFLTKATRFVCLCVCVCVSVIRIVTRWLHRATRYYVRLLVLTTAQHCNIIKMIRRRIRIIWIICIKSHFGR